MAVGLAPSSCLARVQRLQSEGVLRGAHADVDPEALGVGLQALIAVQLRQHSSETAAQPLTKWQPTMHTLRMVVAYNPDTQSKSFACAYSAPCHWHSAGSWRVKTSMKSRDCCSGMN